VLHHEGKRAKIADVDAEILRMQRVLERGCDGSLPKKE